MLNEYAIYPELSLIEAVLEIIKYDMREWLANFCKLSGQNLLQLISRCLIPIKVWSLLMLDREYLQELKEFLGLLSKHNLIWINIYV